MESSCLDGNVILKKSLGSVEHDGKCILGPELCTKTAYVHPCLDQWISGSSCFCHFLYCMIVFLFHLYSGFTIGCNHARSRFAVSYKSSEIRTPSTKTWQWERRHSKHSRTSNGKSPKTIPLCYKWDASKRKGCVRKMSSRMVSSCQAHPLNPPIFKKLQPGWTPLRVVVEKEELVILWRRSKPLVTPGTQVSTQVIKKTHLYNARERFVSAQHRQVVVIIWTSDSTIRWIRWLWHPKAGAISAWIQLSPQRTFQFLIGAAPTGRQAFSSWGPRANQNVSRFRIPCFMAFRSPYLQIIGATSKGLKQLSSRFTCSTIFRSKSPSCILDHNPMTKSRENLTLAKPPQRKAVGWDCLGCTFGDLRLVNQSVLKILCRNKRKARLPSHRREIRSL